jgi:DNA-directed RNA polymerase I subunit RPA12
MFCQCGALIFFPTLISEQIQCKRCLKIIENPEMNSISISKHFSHDDEQTEIKVKGAKINVSCPKCNCAELSYSTAQVRSADEGQTVFYFCEKCGYKDTVQS